MTAELRPTNRPFSTTPTIELIRRSVSAGSAIEPNEQSRMTLPPSVTKASPEAARRDYGVAVNDDGSVDETETTKLRAIAAE